MTAPETARFTAVLRKPFFAALYSAEVLSVAGDQLARVALSVLVFQATGSALTTAATYAATLLPAVVGGFVIGRVGDALPRRTVMIVTDVVRAACFVAMAVSSVPLAAVLVLLVVAVFIGPAFSSAEISYLAERLTGEEYRAASALRLVSGQAAQVGGFAVGGILVAALAPRGALAVNACTFVVSSVVAAVALAGRWRSTGRHARGSTAAASPVDRRERSDDLSGEQPGGRFWRDRQMRGLLGLSALVGFFVVPEGLAVPVGHELGGSAPQIGALLAAGALGGALGALFIVRSVSPSARVKVARWMAVGCGGPLAVSGVIAQWQLVLICWFASGFLAAYVVEAMTVLVQAMPADRRAHLVGVANAVLLGAQGAGLLVFGAVAATMSAQHSVAVAGLVGSALAVAVVLGPLRSRRLPAPRAATANQ